MAMDRAWMYGWQRPEKNSRDKLEKFIEAAKKDAMIKGNMNDLEEFFDADDLQMLDSGGDGRDGGYCEPVPSCSIDGMGFGQDDDDDADDLEEVLKHFKADILLEHAKGLEHFNKVKEAAKQSPKQPGIDIDVFLEPLMEDMAKLWDKGVKIWDAHAKEDFTLRGIIFVTINDYPALFSLLGQIKGKTGCLVCSDDTPWTFLEGSKKVVYLKYQRFLVEGHRYRWKLFYFSFDGKPETGFARKRRHNSIHDFDMVKNIKVCYGKKSKRAKAPIEMMAPLIEQHLNIIRAESSGRSEVWVLKEHKKRFSRWLMDQNIEDGTTMDEITLKRFAWALLHRSVPKEQKHIVASGKQSIIGVDSVDDIDAYNGYDNIEFFTDLPTKIQSVEKSLKGVKPWVRTDGEPRIVTA
ncbi:hypothetical protein U9M48_030808 [Paspalum notatum var. saurae]|uniref:Uncharacterized protein n=1 Tax=Paspalum notatum var. saurae TaxID=547442 RepID=A0AAQ3X2N0_PASNO